MSFRRGWIGEPGTGLSFPMRWILMACGPLNLVGAICFSPLFGSARQAFDLAEGEGFYLWVLSASVLAFGAAYFHQGWTGRANRAVLALGTSGKLVFAWQLIVLGARSNWPLLYWGAVIPDLGCGGLFGWWLWRHRNSAEFQERD